MGDVWGWEETGGLMAYDLTFSSREASVHCAFASVPALGLGSRSLRGRNRYKLSGYRMAAHYCSTNMLSLLI